MSVNPAPPQIRPGLQRNPLADRLRRTRDLTEILARPIPPEEQVVQSMPDASPTKWHRAHTTWFFEQFILKPYLPDYELFDRDYGYLFNSYYEAVGKRHARPQRGLLGRPGCQEIAAYRRHVDAAMEALIESATAEQWAEIAPFVELGINHEQQHQELLMTDLLHALSHNPLYPAYQPYQPSEARLPAPITYLPYEAGEYVIGHEGETFSFDNERPAHRVRNEAFALGDRLITNGEWLEFMADGGYQTPTLWLADGWATVQDQGWEAPLYWVYGDADGWQTMTLSGLQPINTAAPVTHISFYEADAFASWAGKRLPTEAEWEMAASRLAVSGHFLEDGYYRPLPDDGTAAAPEGQPRQMFGDVWEWTQSAYQPYPGFRTAAGAIGEYNGKFMCNQKVLRGGSCVTPRGHVRATYRNFFYPHHRWQFSGLRLAEDR